MAKRKLTSLRSVLLRYLLLCGGGCALILVLWWVIFMQLINIGFLLPAVASAQACADARETVASMTADTFDSLQISDLCRWAVVQKDAVLQTNMDDRHLKIALNAFHGGSGNLGYQYDVKMADGSFCLLQYDYATPYADPALRDTLPDFQTCYILLLAVLILAWLGWQTHCTVRVFAAETARLHRAVDAIAAQQPERIDADGAHLREFSATLQAMQTMGRELTDSLQSQWRMEQQRAEQIAELNYLDTIELAYSGAQIIHPKTIKPLQNKNIPLYVRPFGDKRKPGTVIRGMSAPVVVPILILKKDQVLLTIRSRDFSFVLEEKFATIFSLLERFRIKTNLIHNSAVNLSLCVDNSWHIDEAIEALREAGFDVMKAENMELLTVRGYTDELWRKYARGPQVFVRQATQSTVRVVRKRS